MTVSNAFDAYGRRLLIANQYSSGRAATAPIHVRWDGLVCQRVAVPGAPFDMIRILTGQPARPGIVEPDAAPNYDEVKQQLGRTFLDE
jgi:hypothetical protein